MTAEGLLDFANRLEKIEEEFKKKLKMQENAHHEEYKKLSDTFDTELKEMHERAVHMLIESAEPQKNNFTVNRKPSLDDRIDPAAYAEFDENPYFIIPATKNSVHVLIPKFYPDFQAGWLKDEIGAYYRYEVDQYSIFFGDVPADILKEIEMPPPIKATIEDNVVHFAPEDLKQVKEEFAGHIRLWADESAIIKNDHEFDIIALILKSGHIPFKKTPVAQEDLTNNSNLIKLRTYQASVWNSFMKTGATGVFHPTGSGKSFIGMFGLEHLKVGQLRNLIIAPRLTLLDQWKYYIEKNIPECLDNTLITTYQGFKKFDEEFGLTIFDECQALPAPNFSRLATVKTKYRMGLSAAPFREDGKNHLIIALTGHPESLNWPYYMQHYGPGYHQINVHIVNKLSTKVFKAEKLFNPKKRTMIYSYGLDIGQQAADRMNLPFIHGETENRLDVMRESHSFVASSVFTEGISIHDLDHIIEIDFHFGSRREELQLTGRLMHSKSKNKVHDIIMTQAEYDRYKKRILVLEEKGFHVKIIGGN